MVRRGGLRSPLLVQSAHDLADVPTIRSRAPPKPLYIKQFTIIRWRLAAAGAENHANCTSSQLLRWIGLAGDRVEYAQADYGGFWNILIHFCNQERAY